MVLTSTGKKNQTDTPEQIEEQKELFLEIEKLAGLGEVLSGVAHEINNPLQIILGKTQILLMRLSGDKDSSKWIEDLRSIEKGAQRIAELVNNLNGLSPKKPEEKKLKTDIDLKYLIDSILPLIKASLKDKKIELSLELPDGLPKIQGNPSQLKELFLFLTLNAKQRIERTGKLEVKFKKEDKYLKAEFNDQGEVFSEEVLTSKENSLSFQPGKRTHLWILNCCQILKEQSGKLRIEKRAGKGNTLTVWLPFI